MNRAGTRATWNYMSRIEEFSDHNNGESLMTGWAGTDSLCGMLLQPKSSGVFDVKF